MNNKTPDGMTTEEAANFMQETLRLAFPPNAEDAIKAAKQFIAHNATSEKRIWTTNKKSDLNKI